ncbi:NAD-dependent epimerase/dehydratase family protein [Prochlorothrix hollandica]|uniref:NAD-dependent epimerase/dehydratase family protein n=1 Tax=Prochlorothrix hollandica TaxID=1223 RepID=UPI0033413CD1
MSSSTPLTVLVTGASGFLGQYVVAAALRQGYRVRAVVRPASNLAKISWGNHPQLEPVRLDLRSSRGLAEALQGVAGVIHLAAVKGGDFHDRFAGTVIATENLLTAMAQTQVSRLVAISTFSVYGYQQIRPGSRLTEDSPLERNPLDRDYYAQTKLIQEDLIRQYEAQSQSAVTILRPGMIYGRECLWHALLGAELSETHWLKVGGGAVLPMIYVENCAEAIVLAVEAQDSIGQTVNLVDDACPTQNQYIQGLLRHDPTPPKLTPVPWWLVRGIGGLAWWINQRLLGGQARLPSILVPAQLEARFRSLRFPNDRAKSLLHWTPRYSLESALDRSYSDYDLLS